MSTTRQSMFRAEAYVYNYANVLSQKILNKLNFKLQPDLYLIGFRDTDGNGEPICIIPPACIFQPHQFSSVMSEAERIALLEPREPFIITEEHEKNRIRMLSICKALDARVEELEKKAGLYTCYISYPTKVGNYIVSVVLRLRKEAFESHYRFQKNHGMFPEIQIPKSFLEATLFSFLQSIHETLQVPDPDTIYAGSSDDEVLRRAGKMMMRTPILSINTAYGMPDLFEACHVLSTLKYEGQDGAGTIVFANRGHRDLDVRITFTKPRRLQDYRASRKLLEMTSEKLSLLCDSESIYGLGSILPSYDPLSQTVFEVQFLKQFVWDFKHHGKTMMHVSYGIPSLNRPEFPLHMFKEGLQFVFHGLDSQSADKLIGIAAAFIKQKHGCVLVITDAANTEAVRLSNQCIATDPIPINEELVTLTTAIDGAVIIDLEGRCHAIGAILDGRADNRCDPGRGSRYNSALRYAFQDDARVVLVKSEDGMIDWFPKIDQY